MPYPSLISGRERKKYFDRFNIICHDQEPLNFDFYQNYKFDDFLNECGFDCSLKELVATDWTTKNLDMIPAYKHVTLYDQTILVHSEANSVDVAKYQEQGYPTVHYWCHGVVSMDWYRFAKHDSRLNFQEVPSKDFLIYARDWSGTREYRLKFLELLKTNKLLNYSKCFFSAVTTNDLHYTDYNFHNPRLQIHAKDLHQDLLPSVVDSNASADYDVDDFCSTKISVVLETVFDDTKVHLTEKICRALACGHPFILAAGPRSLEYLRKYGFETFSPWLDESYDSEPDSVRRLEKIVDCMKKFADQPVEKKNELYRLLKTVAVHNQKRFFSQDFAQQLTSELKNNLESALDQASYTRGQKFLAQRKTTRKIYNSNDSKKYLRYPEFKQHIKLLRQLRQQKKSF